MNTPRPFSVRPMARNRRSPCEWAASGRMASGRVKRLSMTETESPCFSHLARLPLSQSKPFACEAMIARKICNCIGKCQAAIILYQVAHRERIHPSPQWPDYRVYRQETGEKKIPEVFRLRAQVQRCP